MRGAYGETLLHAAFLFRQGDVVKYLVANHKELINVAYNDVQYEGEVVCSASSYKFHIFVSTFGTFNFMRQCTWQWQIGICLP